MKMSAWQRPIVFSLVKGIFSTFSMAWILSSSPLAFLVRLALRMIFVETRPRVLRRTMMRGAMELPGGDPVCLQGWRKLVISSTQISPKRVGSGGGVIVKGVDDSRPREFSQLVGVTGVRRTGYQRDCVPGSPVIGILHGEC